MDQNEKIAGAFDCIVMNINNALKHLITGQYIAFSDAMHGIAMQTPALKNDTLNQLNEKDGIIRQLTEKDGAGNGEQHHQTDMEAGRAGQH